MQFSVPLAFAFLLALLMTSKGLAEPPGTVVVKEVEANSKKIKKAGDPTTKDCDQDQQVNVLQSCKAPDDAEVIHYPQLHWRPEFKGSSKMTETVARAQFGLGQYIQANPGIEVFREALIEDADPKLYAKLEKAGGASMIGAVKMIFPTGIPATFEEMSSLQKEVLAEEGAAMVLWYLGKVPTLHKTITPEESKRIDEAVDLKAKKYGGRFYYDLKAIFEEDPEVKDLMLTQSEKAAAKEIATFRNANPGKKALLVYGSAHDFAPYFKDVKFHRLAGCPSAEPETKPGEKHERTNRERRKMPGFAGKIRDLAAEYSAAKPGSGAQTKVAAKELALIEEKKKSGEKISVWDWQFFSNPELKTKALEILDPATAKNSYELDGLRQIAAKDAKVKAAVEKWITANGGK